MTVFKEIRLHLEHALNPLHVYCRLLDMGFSKDFSRRVCVIYERRVMGRRWNHRLLETER